MHPSTKRAKARQRYAKRRAEGTCTQCGEAPAVDGITLCQECREKRGRKANPNKKRVRDACRKLGICVICTTRQAMPRRKWCAVCSEANTEIVQRRRERLIAAGICTVCGVKPAVEGIRKCQACREKCNEYDRQRRMKRRNAA